MLIAVATLVAGCGDGDASGEAGNKKGLPVYLNPNKPAGDVVTALGGKFCEQGVLTVTELEAIGYSMGSCGFASTGGRGIFYVFKSETELRLYLDNQPCEAGFYHERGPTWLFSTLGTTEAAEVEEAGAIPLTCN